MMKVTNTLAYCAAASYSTVQSFISKNQPFVNKSKMFTNIAIGCKYLIVTNTLAYSAAASDSSVQSFIAEAKD